MNEILLERPYAYHQYGRTLEKIQDVVLRSKERTEPSEGFWLFGPTGVGKTHMAYAMCEGVDKYLYPNDKGWWDAYSHQHTVIINDFRGEITYNTLLQMVDKWGFSVPRRCREPIPFLSKRIIITSSQPPEEVYHNLAARDSLDQLFRRFKVLHLISRDECVEYVRPQCSMVALHS